MTFKLTLAALALAAMAVPAHASVLCIEQTIDGGTATVTAMATSSASSGWDGVAVKCTLLSGRASIAPSRDAKGICGPALSTIGSEKTGTYPVTIDLADIDQFAKLDAKAWAKAIKAEAIAALKEWRKPNPVAPIYQPWANGSCN